MILFCRIWGNGSHICNNKLYPCKAEAVTGDSISMQVLAMNMNPDYTYSPVGFAADIYVGKALTA